MTKGNNYITPQEAQQLIAEQRAILVDVREHDEFAREHVAGSVSLPLSGIHANDIARLQGSAIILTCRSGMRTGTACQQIALQHRGDTFVMQGGLDAWKKSEFPLVVNKSAPLEMTRQVHLVAGLLVLLGIILGNLVHPAYFGISAFVGIGLTFAGATGFCGMARLLALAPWNRVASG